MKYALSSNGSLHFDLTASNSTPRLNMMLISGRSEAFRVLLPQLPGASTGCTGFGGRRILNKTIFFIYKSNICSLFRNLGGNQKQ